MRKFLYKLAVILLPLMICLASYLALDPFEVIYRYQRHYNDRHLVYNWDYNQTEVLLANYPKYRYDSFILGNSRSRSFLCDDWSRHLPGIRPFHYDASAETLFGVYNKLAFLERSGMGVKHALVVLDSDLLSKVTNSAGHLYIKHPKVSNESELDFHAAFVAAYCDPRFLAGFLYYKLTGHVSPAFEEFFLPDDIEVRFDPVTSDFFYVSSEQEISRDPDAYFRARASRFPKRMGTELVSERCIKDEQLKMLRGMKRIFDRFGTDYQIVISPLYDQMKFNPDDFKAMTAIFGAGRVHDYSGINAFTGEVRNFYEESHYRPVVARQIMDRIYR